MNSRRMSASKANDPLRVLKYCAPLTVSIFLYCFKGKRPAEGIEISCASTGARLHESFKGKRPAEGIEIISTKEVMVTQPLSFKGKRPAEGIEISSLDSCPGCRLWLQRQT